MPHVAHCALKSRARNSLFTSIVPIRNGFAWKTNVEAPLSVEAENMHRQSSRRERRYGSAGKGLHNGSCSLSRKISKSMSRSHTSKSFINTSLYRCQERELIGFSGTHVHGALVAEIGWCSAAMHILNKCNELNTCSNTRPGGKIGQKPIENDTHADTRHFGLHVRNVVELSKCKRFRCSSTLFPVISVAYHNAPLRD